MGRFGPVGEFFFPGNAFVACRSEPIVADFGSGKRQSDCGPRVDYAGHDAFTPLALAGDLSAENTTRMAVVFWSIGGW